MPKRLRPRISDPSAPTATERRNREGSGGAATGEEEKEEEGKQGGQRAVADVRELTRNSREQFLNTKI